MLKILSFTDLHKAVQDKLSKNTELSVYDVPPENEPAPLVYLEVVGKRLDPHKTMYKETFTVYIHAIASKESNRGKTPVYDLINQVEEALTENVILPECFQLIGQVETGVISMQRDESGEWHAILSFEFKVLYGYMTK